MDFPAVVAGNNEPVQVGVGKPVLRFHHLTVDLIANPEVQSQFRRNPPIVLSVEVGPQGSSIGFAPSDTCLRAGRVTEQKIGEGVTVCQTRRRRRESRTETETAARVWRTERIEAQSIDIGAELQAVRAGRPRQVIEKIETVVSAQDKRPRVAHGSVRIGEIDGRVAHLVRVAGNALYPGDQAEIHSTIFTFLASGDTQKAGTKFIDQIWRN